MVWPATHGRGGARRGGKREEGRGNKPTAFALIDLLSLFPARVAELIEERGGRMGKKKKKKKKECVS